jgi:phosphate transport system substrate-binding protein
VDLGDVEQSVHRPLRIGRLRQAASIKPADQRRAAVRRGRGYAAILLLALCGGATAEVITIGGTGAALGTMRVLAAEFGKSSPEIQIKIVPSLGSGGAVKAMIDGAIDLAVTSRTLTQGELKLGAREIEYARTPFVFAVSSASSVTSITGRDLADIYSGRMAAWPDGTPIRPILRPESDYDTELTMGISPELRRGTLEARTRPGVRLAVNDQDAANDLERIEGAIGPTTLALIVSERRALRALKFDGKEPSVPNAASGVYPFHKSLYFVRGPRHLASVDRLVAFIQSTAGKDILANNGQWTP